MGATIRNIKRYQVGGNFQIIADVDFSGSYVTGGSSEAIPPASIGLVKIEYLTVLPRSGYMFDYDTTTGNTRVFGSGNLPVFHNAQALGTVKATLGGTPSPKLESNNTPNNTDQSIIVGPMAEIPNGYPSFTGITSSLMAIGH